MPGLLPEENSLNGGKGIYRRTEFLLQDEQDSNKQQEEDKTPKRNVLIVSFNFPSANSTGAIRVGKFAKYLPEFGWEPIILRVDEVKGCPQTLPLEASKVNIIRTPYFAPATFVREHLIANEDKASPPLRNNYQGVDWRESGALSVAIAVIAGVVIYALGIFLLKAFSKEDKWIIREALSGLKPRRWREGFIPKRIASQPQDPIQAQERDTKSKENQ